MCVWGGGGKRWGVGLRRLDEKGVQIDRWMRVDNGRVEGGTGRVDKGGGGAEVLKLLRLRTAFRNCLLKTNLVKHILRVV